MKSRYEEYYKITKKENEVLEALINEGCSSSCKDKICKKMNIKPTTLRGHIQKLFEKFFVSCMEDLIIKAMEKKQERG